MGYSIIEDTDGTEKWRHFLIRTNQKRRTGEWEDIVNETDLGGNENPREETKL